MKLLAAALAALLAAPSGAAVLFSETVRSQGGTATLDAAFGALSGELWAKVSGGLIDYGWIDIQGDHLYAWWDFGGYDEDGNPINIYSVNNSQTGVDCSWNYSSGCAAVDRGLLHWTVPAPVNYDHCFPWDGTYGNLCMSITTYSFTYFRASASAPDGAPVTFAIYDTNPGVPEPAAWALLLTGFTLTGTVLRRRDLARCARAG